MTVRRPLVIVNGAVQQMPSGDTLPTDTAPAGSGEANTASNIGTGSVGWYDSKSGVDLRFKTVNSQSSILTFTDNPTEHRIDVNIVESNLTAMGGATSLAAGTKGVVPAPVAGDNVKYLRGDGTWGTPPGTGEANTAANINLTGVGVYSTKSGVQLQFKGISATSKLSVTDDGTNRTVKLDIVEGNLAAFVGTDGVSNGTRGVVPAPTNTQGNYFLRGDGTWADISSSGSLGEINTAANINTAGIGIFDNKTGVQLQFKGIKSVNNKITVADSTSDHTVSLTFNESNLATFQGDNGTGTPAPARGYVPAPTTGDAAANKYLSADGSWSTPPAVGESNTASNVNTAGIGVFKQKTGVNLEFKGIKAGTTKLSVTNVTSDNTVTIDVVESNFTAFSGANGVSGGAKGVVPAPAAADNVKYLKGDGTWSAIVLGESNTASNVNTAGVGIFKQKTGVNLEFKGIKGGSSKITASNIGADNTIALDLDETQLTTFVGDSGAGGVKGVVPAPGSGDAVAQKFLCADGTWALPSGTGGEANTASNVNTAGVGVFKQKNGVNLEFKGLKAGSSILSVTNSTGDNTVAVDIVEANLTTFAGDSGSGGVKGVVPAPGSGDAAAGKFLSANGSWALPSGGGGGGSAADDENTIVAAQVFS